MRRSPGRSPEEAAEINLASLVFAGLGFFGLVGSVLAVGPTEPFYKLALFGLMGAGAALSFLGLNAFHRRRVEETGDPRTTLYSAFAIWSSLSFSVLSACLALVIVGRFFGILGEEAAGHVAYYFITIVALVQFSFGLVLYRERKRRGLLERRIFLYPWSSWWQRRAMKRRMHDDEGEG